MLTRMRGWLVLVVLSTSSVATAKPGAIFIPPAEVDIGAGTSIGDIAVGASTEVRAGVHWASLYWRPTPLDIGIGYAGSFRELLPPYAQRSLDPEQNQLSLHGMYFSMSYAIENHGFWRTWLGARVEGLSGDHAGKRYDVLGAALRIHSELYSTGAKGVGNNNVAAFFAGAFALGVYVEGTKRFGLPAELGSAGVGAGVTMRVPFILAIGG